MLTFLMMWELGVALLELLVASFIPIPLKPLWRGEQCWRECLHLLSVAEAAASAASVKSTDDGRGQTTHDYIVRRRSL